jgi:hypothetical protein
MDRLQILLQIISFIFYAAGAFVSFINFYIKRLYLWLISGLLLLFLSFNKILILLSKTSLIYLERYRLFAIDLFISLAVIIILLLFLRFIKKIKKCLHFNLISVILLIGAILLGFLLELFKFQANLIVILQLSQDFLLASASVFIFSSFIRYLFKIKEK